ncbi:MAG: sigma-54-dependent Fis family transcriptional regulator [Deltaproteobacteria bacterium]|nr:sigma-54-dependent Fis family transcriptional regulator [Deltaproteobacteria bacterium]
MRIDQNQPTSRIILMVDDDSDFRWTVSNVLTSAGYCVLQAKDGNECIECLETDIPDLILLDFRMPGKDGLHVADEIKKKMPAIPIVMITAYGDIKSAVEAMKIGVYDYASKPIDNNDLLFTVQRALETQDLMQEITRLRKALGERTTLYERMGSSDSIKKLVQLVEKVAPTPFTVLIQGESGTGKELVAQAIHDMSHEKNGPFIAVDCGAIPETLIESELFGYQKGAFTGAHANKSGYFELASGGTLFLDEVGNLPYPSQQKILRAMQERQIQRLGAKKTESVHVRIIAATNQPLEADVSAGRFRSDLFFRLKEFIIDLPALRNRKEDIPYLAKRFMDEAQVELKKNCSGFSREALNKMMSCSWPGNVRELRNVIRQAVLLCDVHEPICPEHLILTGDSTSLDNTETVCCINPDHRPLKEIILNYTGSIEKRLITEEIERCGGNKSEAARRLDIDYKTLLRKMKINQLR